MEKQELTRRMGLSEVLLPLLQATLKNKNLKLINLFEEVDSKVHELISELENEINIKKDDKLILKNELTKTLSKILSYEAIYNKNEYLDEHIENILELFLSQKKINEQLLINKKENNNSKLFYSLSNIYSEVNKFHSMLYFSSYIQYDDLKKLNNEIVKNSNKNISALIMYLKSSSFNDNTFIYDIIKIATNIYSDILEGLFVNLSKSDLKIKDYIKFQEKYILKIEQLFVEQYSLLNSSCNNLNKKLTMESNDEKNS